ncbi:MAG: DNA helicase-2/ATP-dependent DNA helicase PcrA, partial [Oleiphilaceae bacterium]
MADLIKSNFSVLQKSQSYIELSELIMNVEYQATLSKPDPMSMTTLRKSLEDILNRISILGPPKEKIFNKLSILKSEWPNCWALSFMHHIRVAGNDAAHNTSYSLSQEKLVEFLYKQHEILRWYFEDVLGSNSEIILSDFDRNYYFHAKDEQSGTGLHYTEALSVSRQEDNEPNVTLNMQQKMLAENATGRHFVNAPPGTGKTELISHRLKFMKNKFPPEDIVCLTFTNRAAFEMKDRVSHIFSEKSEDFKNQIFVGNIHAFCRSLLGSGRVKSYGNLPINSLTLLDDVFGRELEESAYSEFTKIDNKDLNEIRNEINEVGINASLIDSSNHLRLVISDFNNRYVIDRTNQSDIDQREFKDIFFKKLAKELSIVHALLIEDCTKDIKDILLKYWHLKISEFISKTSSINSYRFDIDETSALIWAYLSWLMKLKRNIKCYDFDDLISLGLVKLKETNRKYGCIQVDEVQDLNLFQWLIIESITSENSAVMALGDTDQGIYRFLGADDELLQNYTKSFERHSLDNNYRAVKPLIDLLNEYRQVNSFSYAGPMKYSGERTTDGVPALIVKYLSSKQEIAGCVDAVRKILRFEERSVGILLRYNKRVDAFATALEAIADGEEALEVFRVSARDLMKHPVIIDFISLIKCYNGRASRLDWYRLVYRFSKSSGSKDATRANARQFIDSLHSTGVSPRFILPSKYIKGSTGVRLDYSARSIVEQARKSNARIVIFDTETTDTDTKSAVLLQLAAVAIENGQISEHYFDKIIKLDNKKLQEPEFLEKLKNSSEIHKIGLDQIKEEGKPPAEIFDEFFEFIGGDETLLIAHNLPYDLRVLSRNIDEMGEPEQLSKFLGIVSTRAFDSLALARGLYPEQNSYKLGDLLSAFSLDGVNSHNALDDVKATANLMIKMINDIEPRLDDIDNILDMHSVATKHFQEHFYKLNRLFSDLDVNFGDSKSQAFETNMSGILGQWIDYSYSNENWYGHETLRAITTQINRKLVPWLDKRFKPGLLFDVLDTYSIPFNEFELASEIDLIDPKKNRVIVSTIHRAKGLQFESVIIPEVVDDLYPSFFALKNGDEVQIEED